MYIDTNIMGLLKEQLLCVRADPWLPYGIEHRNYQFFLGIIINNEQN